MEKAKKIYDISITVKENMLSFPGDTFTEIERIKEIEDDGYNLSKMKVSVHTGTHADAPSHFIENGKYIDEISLERFMGRAQVIEIKNKKVITKEELENIEIKCDKVLFKTVNSRYLKEESFNKDFVYINYKAAEYLVENGVKLIAIDYLTVESLDSKDFQVHKLLLENEVIIIETVDLETIEPGFYNLLAFPLKLKGCEASPIRALLTK